ncbi:hypothetical protein ACKWTF_010753 [Chironomus riparius]
MFKKVNHENILPVRAMNFLNTASFIYSCRNKSIHSNINFERNQGKRNQMDLRSTTAKNNFGRKDIHHFGVNIYNYLPIAIRKAVHIHSFKNQVRRFVASEEFLSSCFSNDYLKTFG